MGEGAEGAGQNVLCVPEFTFNVLLRPYDGFAGDYQGTPVNERPLMFSEQGQAYDEIAASGAGGYDPNLVRGLPCKIGQRVIVLIPGMFTSGPADFPYIWKFVWRLRNLHDFRVACRTRYNYSLPKQGQGVADTTGPNPGPRVVIPAARQTVVYNQDEPVVVGNALVNHLVYEDLEFALQEWGTPFVPGGADGAVQQGILPSTTSDYTQAVFGVHEMQAVGDELLIGMYRSVDAGNNWDFGGVDAVIASFFGAQWPDSGIYVCRGISP